jgi:hypothetical protein
MATVESDRPFSCASRMSSAAKTEARTEGTSSVLRMNAMMNASHEGSMIGDMDEGCARYTIIKVRRHARDARGREETDGEESRAGEGVDKEWCDHPPKVDGKPVGDAPGSRLTAQL